MLTKDVHINQLFPKHLFWDVDMSCLDIDKDRDLIIPRALIATTPSTFTNDIEKLEIIYPKAVIARELKTTKEKVSNQICRLVARRYHVNQFARFSNECHF
ncbi:MAG: Bromodomain containing protein [Mucilaginibacter sp.]|nr:Bromodomain containing protein [Mucilaginibacter sp.]